MLIPPPLDQLGESCKTNLNCAPHPVPLWNAGPPRAVSFLFVCRRRQAIRTVGALINARRAVHSFRSRAGRCGRRQGRLQPPSLPRTCAAPGPPATARSTGKIRRPGHPRPGRPRPPGPFLPAEEGADAEEWKRGPTSCPGRARPGGGPAACFLGAGGDPAAARAHAVGRGARGSGLPAARGPARPAPRPRAAPAARGLSARGRGLRARRAEGGAGRGLRPGAVPGGGPGAGRAEEGGGAQKLLGAGPAGGRAGEWRRAGAGGPGRGWRSLRGGWRAQGAGPAGRCAPAAMAFRRRTKSYPLFSQEFVIHNHADIGFCLVLCVLIGLMFEVSEAGEGSAPSRAPPACLTPAGPRGPRRSRAAWLPRTLGAVPALCTLPPLASSSAPTLPPLRALPAGSRSAAPLGSRRPLQLALSAALNPQPGLEPTAALPPWPNDWGFLSGVREPSPETPRPAVIAQLSSQAVAARSFGLFQWEGPRPFSTSRPVVWAFCILHSGLGWVFTCGPSPTQLCSSAVLLPPFFSALAQKAGFHIPFITVWTVPLEASVVDAELSPVQRQGEGHGYPLLWGER